MPDACLLNHNQTPIKQAMYNCTHVLLDDQTPGHFRDKMMKWSSSPGCLVSDLCAWSLVPVSSHHPRPGAGVCGVQTKCCTSRDEDRSGGGDQLE